MEGETVMVMAEEEEAEIQTTEVEVEEAVEIAVVSSVGEEMAIMKTRTSHS
jgi:hypothetical protein